MGGVIVIRMSYVAQGSQCFTFSRSRARLVMTQIPRSCRFFPSQSSAFAAHEPVYRIQRIALLRPSFHTSLQPRRSRCVRNASNGDVPRHLSQTRVKFSRCEKTSRLRQSHAKSMDWVVSRLTETISEEFQTRKSLASSVILNERRAIASFARWKNLRNEREDYLTQLLLLTW